MLKITHPLCFTKFSAILVATFLMTGAIAAPGDGCAGGAAAQGHQLSESHQLIKTRRLTLKQIESSERLQNVIEKTNTTHKTTGSNNDTVRVTTRGPLQEVPLGLPLSQLFQNDYSANSMVFKANYREYDLGFYASDVYLHQYLLASKLRGFEDTLPKTLVRANIVNKDTHKIITLYKDGSQDTFLKEFMKTPNGKSTKRFMDILGLKAADIEVTRGSDDSPESYTVTIHVILDPLVYHKESDV